MAKKKHGDRERKRIAREYWKRKDSGLEMLAEKEGISMGTLKNYADEFKPKEKQ